MPFSTSYDFIQFIHETLVGNGCPKQTGLSLCEMESLAELRLKPPVPWFHLPVFAPSQGCSKDFRPFKESISSSDEVITHSLTPGLRHGTRHLWLTFAQNGDDLNISQRSKSHPCTKDCLKVYHIYVVCHIWMAMDGYSQGLAAWRSIFLMGVFLGCPWVSLVLCEPSLNPFQPLMQTITN